MKIFYGRLKKSMQQLWADFNPDYCAGLVIFSALTLLYTPAFLLLRPHWAMLMLSGFFVLCLMFKKQTKYWLSFMLLLGLMTYMHGSALGLIHKAENVGLLGKNPLLTFSVESIVNQQDYQAVIIKTQQSEQLIYTNWKAESMPKLGEIRQANIQLRPISSRLNQGGFDRQKWYFSKGISAYGTVKSAVKIGEDLSWRERRLQQALQQTAGLKQQGLLLALTFGERAWLSNSVWKIYQQTNTAHLIAISGLHITLAMSLGFFLARAVQIFLPTRFISPYFPLITGFMVAVIYSELAGFAIPTLRAIVAMVIVLASRLYRRYCTVWQFFVRTVAVLLLLDPMMILSAGFWLSVGAVGCLILWYRLFPLSAWIKPASFWYKTRYIWGLMHLQFGLLLLFTPIQWTIFSGFSLHGFSANLVAVPIFSLLLTPLGLFAVFTDGALNSWRGADWLAAWLTEILTFWQNGWVAVSNKTTLIFTALLAVLLILTAYLKFRHRRNGYIYGAVGLLLYSVVSMGYQYKKQSDWQLIMLDVGQGLAMLIVKNNHAVLYDSGAAWSGGSMAEIEILPYLTRQGLQLDQLVLSHDDNDHAGGAAAILQAYPQVPFLTPSEKNYGKNDRAFCVQGLAWQWQGLNFKVLSPPKIVREADNPDSCVIMISDGSYNVLLTGDADIATENRLLPLLGKIDVLQVGHHGSKTSGGEKLIAHIQPNVALISAGRWNPWKMPHTEVVERLQRHRSAVYNSAVLGQVTVNFTPQGMQIHSARTDYSPWYADYIKGGGRP